MANLLSHSSVEERLDLTFAASSSFDLRDRPAKFWRVLGGGSAGKILSSTHSESLDAYVLSESNLFISANRLVLVSSRDVLQGGLSLLWRYPEARVEAAVYQRRGDRGANDFRKNFARLRAEAGDRLGPAVVTGETVLFYPGQVGSTSAAQKNRARLAGERSCVQLVMRKLSPKIEAVFRKIEPSQSPAALKELGVGNLLKGFAVDEHFFSAGGFAMTGVKGEEYFTLHASAMGARFEFGGRLRAEVSRAIERLLAIFAPKFHEIEALSGGQDFASFALPCAPGTHWEPQPLGLHDARFILRSSDAA